MAKEKKEPRTTEAPWTKGHGLDHPLRSKVKGGLHTKAALKRAGSPQGDRIGERTKGLS
ncbi:hypothetical protein LG634_16325 [Streptomyces bambusae]|uniref:hypothetical protein n=1 Tax=Streptomyces bambusae TaxID=1550616 RepID=UPI001CFC6184|nr:hypothetical protein [Streptomyces bambusae]MCB5166397.1 hypothetical protein [Streptomyces bambusae]